jgi:hypothetical protein
VADTVASGNPNPLELPFLDARGNRGQFRVGRRNDMNDKNEQSQGQEKLKDTSLEDKEREENSLFADQLHARALGLGDKTAIELERLVQGRISTAMSSDHW